MAVCDLLCSPKSSVDMRSPKTLCELSLALAEEDGWEVVGLAPYIGWRSHARLTVPYWGCPTTSSAAGARFGMASLINTAQSPSIAPLPLHHSTLTRLVNLGSALTYSSLETRPIGAAHWARKPRDASALVCLWKARHPVKQNWTEWLYKVFVWNVFLLASSNVLSKPLMIA